MTPAEWQEVADVLRAELLNADPNALAMSSFERRYAAGVDGYRKALAGAGHDERAINEAVSALNTNPQGNTQ